MVLISEPPWELSAPARAIWDRHVTRLSKEGRLATVDHDQLIVYCETAALYRELLEDINAFGAIIEGRQSARVKHPALSALSACRESMLKISKEIGLHSPISADGIKSVDDLLGSLGISADGNS